MDRKGKIRLFFVVFLGHILLYAAVEFASRSFKQPIFVIAIYFFLSFLWLASLQEKGLFKLWGWFILGHWIFQLFLIILILSFLDGLGAKVGAAVVVGVTFYGVLSSLAALLLVKLYRWKKAAKGENAN